MRLKSLGDEYLSKNIEKRIAEKEKFPNAVSAKSRSAGEIEQSFYATITQTIIEIRTMRYKPSKTNPKKIYSLDNDKDINFLSEQLLTMHDLNLNSRDRIYLRLNGCHIEYILKSLGTVSSEIHNIRAYLITALYNAPSTMGNYQLTKDNYFADGAM